MPVKTGCFSYAVRKAAGFLFPPLCIICKQHSEGPGISAWLCSDCLSLLQKNHDSRTNTACPFCSEDLRSQPHGICGCKKPGTLPYERMYSVFDFDETLKVIVHEFKYNGFKRLSYLMGTTFAPLVPESFFLGMDLVTPVPLHFLRRLNRGYNQADFFAAGIVAGAVHSPPLVHSVLRRKRVTKTQTNLSRGSRLLNVTGAFAMVKRNQPLVRGKGIVLVDDVVTTGATTAQCASMLLEAGAKSVRVLSLARD
jgi:competence protein ComFC